MACFKYVSVLFDYEVSSKIEAFQTKLYSEEMHKDL